MEDWIKLLSRDSDQRKYRKKKKLLFCFSVLENSSQKSSHAVEEARGGEELAIVLFW